jgi:predicted Zn-dependent protease
MRSACSKTRIALIVALALAGYPAYRAAWHFWGVHQFSSAQSALERRDFDEARRRLQQYLSAWPSEPNARLLAAQTARRRGDIDEAVEHLRAYAEADARDRSALDLEYDLVRLQTGDLKDAKTYLTRCFDDPTLPETPLVLEAVVRGKIKMLQAAYKEGINLRSGGGKQELTATQDAVELWLRRRPQQADQVQGLVWRSRLHTIGGCHDDAVADLRRVLELDPDHFEGRWLLAMIVRDESPEETARHLQVLAARRPENFEVRFTLANVRRNLAQLDKARDILDELLASRPQDVSYLIERGEVALEQEQPEQAEQFFRLAFQFDPNDARLSYSLSLALRRLGKDDEATVLRDRAHWLETEKNRQQEQVPPLPAPPGFTGARP